MKTLTQILCTMMCILTPAELWALNKSPRPIERSVGLTTVAEEQKLKTGFDEWVRSFRKFALRKGISSKTYDAAFKGVRYDKEVIKLDRNQSEYTKALWEYLDSAVSNRRIRNGKAALRRYRTVLSRIEAKYGVEKEVVVAVWGLETSYGTYRGSNDLITSLATLAYDGRRARFFENELVAALKIIQAGDVAPRKMTGSWAGAMGHTQFMPTSYLSYAVDFTGDGKRDIWSNNPTDALASTAAYLAHFGWVKGQPWGVEVKLSEKFDYGLVSRKITKTPKEWAELGVLGLNGKTVQDYGKGAILLPAGSKGAAFMIFENFRVIERYNSADAYVIGVGHLSDRLKGGPKIQANWPRNDRALKSVERKELQRLLTEAGFDTNGIDGRIGSNTIEALQKYQRAVGITPDGYASYEMLKKLSE